MGHAARAAVQVMLGMIWVWPESGPVAFIESAAAEPAVNQRVKDVDPGTFQGVCAVRNTQVLHTAACPAHAGGGGAVAPWSHRGCTSPRCTMWRAAPRA